MDDLLRGYGQHVVDPEVHELGFPPAGDDPDGMPLPLHLDRHTSFDHAVEVAIQVLPQFGNGFFRS